LDDRHIGTIPDRPEFGETRPRSYGRVCSAHARTNLATVRRRAFSTAVASPIHASGHRGAVSPAGRACKEPAHLSCVVPLIGRR
jgi:hypothetical protein